MWIGNFSWPPGANCQTSGSGEGRFAYVGLGLGREGMSLRKKLSILFFFSDKELAAGARAGSSESGRSRAAAASVAEAGSGGGLGNRLVREQGRTRARFLSKPDSQTAVGTWESLQTGPEFDVESGVNFTEFLPIEYSLRF